MEEPEYEITDKIRWEQYNAWARGKNYPHSENMLTIQGRVAYGKAREKRGEQRNAPRDK